MDTFFSQFFPRIPEKFIVRGIAGALIIAITSLLWDAWWHIAIGRDSFWEPPHLFLYSSVIVAIILGTYGYFEKKETLWRNLVIILALIPLSAPFDDLWHRVFGTENLSTPLIVWSPPHLILFGSLAASCLMLLPLLRKDNRLMERLFGIPLFATAIGMGMLLAGPFYPLGPYKLLSFWGAGFLPIVFIFGYFVARDWLRETGSATLIAMTSVVLYFIYDAVPGAKILIPNYPHIPGFIIVFSHLFPALLLDMVKGGNIPRMVQGATAGMLYGSILYGVGSNFVDYVYHYSTAEMSVAIVSCVAGGTVAGWLSKHAVRKIGDVLR